jgi:hypothetical protein
MRSIQDVAVFTWALVGINGNIANYGHGLPGRGAQPLEGLPVWDPTAGSTSYQGPENQAITRSCQTADGIPALERPTFGYDASCAAHRPSVQRHNSAPTLGAFPHGGRVHTPGIFPQSTGLRQPDGRVFEPHQLDLRRGGVEQHFPQGIPPRESSCDCPARQQCIGPTAPRGHNLDCASSHPSHHENYYSPRNVRRRHG